MMTFAETLNAAMKRKKMSASDLAREVWGESKDKRGYMVARNRDRIGHYLSGKSFPKGTTLTKLAKALSVPVGTLESTKPVPVVRTSGGVTSIRTSFHPDGTATLTMGKVMLSTKTVLKIIDLIEQDTLDRLAKKTL